MSNLYYEFIMGIHTKYQSYSNILVTAIHLRILLWFTFTGGNGIIIKNPVYLAGKHIWRIHQDLQVISIEYSEIICKKQIHTPI